MTTVHSLARHGYQPGLIGRCAAMMSRFYCDKFGLGAAFETATAQGLAHFVEHFDPQRDALWWVQRDDEIVGCLGVDGQAPSSYVRRAAQLRWFYLAASTRGQGLGRRLLDDAIAFARRAGYLRLELTTHGDLQAAVHLYESAGFACTGADAGRHWGRPLILSHYALPLRAETAPAVAAPRAQAAPRPPALPA
jgi:GNAT superfamily N-acetyltransferase